MSDTQKAVSQVAFTKSEFAATFALQMAAQSRKFGERLEERRLEIGLEHQKHLVARMHELGDTGLNTNQVSRYESGEGPMPRENRMELFATALETDVEDLLLGSVAEREKRKDQPTPDPFATSGAETAGAEAKLDELLSGQAELLAELSEVRSEQAHLRQLLERGEHGEEETGT